MMQKDIKLLEYDLCGRIQFDTYVEVEKYHIGILKGVDNGTVSTDRGINYPISMVKPYLRPMSSMTEKEQKEFDEFCVIDYDAWKGNGIKGFKNQAAIISSAMKFLNSHHLDYNNLIERDLALEAKEEMYNI